MDDLRLKLRELEELYRQEATEALNERLLNLTDRALEGLRAEMMLAHQSKEEDPFLALFAANDIGKDWQVFTHELWRRYEVILDSLEQVWTQAERESSMPPLSTQARSQLQVLRGLAPSAEGVATGMAGRFFHLTEQARAKYTDALMRSVLLGQSQQSLHNELGKILQTSRRRTALVLRDSNMQYAREVQYVHAASAGEQWFEFMGPRDAVTRPFCDRYEGKILHVDEISALDNGQTGKGTAMVAGGGFNCRHHWRPVREAWFSPEEWVERRAGIEPPAEVKPTVPEGFSERLTPLFIDNEALLLPKGAEPMSADAFSKQIAKHFQDARGEWLGEPWMKSKHTRILPPGTAPEILKRVLEMSLGRLIRAPQIVETRGGHVLLLGIGKGSMLTIREWNTKSNDHEDYSLTIEAGPNDARKKFKVKR